MAASVAPSAFSATYSDLKLIRTRKVLQLVFEIPLEQAEMALKILGGMPNPAAEIWCAVARLDMNEAVATEGRSANAPAAALSLMPEKILAQRAGMLCNSVLFWKFIEHISGYLPSNEEDAAGYVRKYCCVNSRSSIIAGTPAGDHFEELLNRYAGWKAGIE
jgi:hypothetical protein